MVISLSTTARLSALAMSFMLGSGHQLRACPFTSLMVVFPSLFSLAFPTRPVPSVSFFCISPTMLFDTNVGFLLFSALGYVGKQDRCCRSGSRQLKETPDGSQANERRAIERPGVRVDIERRHVSASVYIQGQDTGVNLVEAAPGEALTMDWVCGRCLPNTIMKAGRAVKARWITARSTVDGRCALCLSRRASKACECEEGQCDECKDECKDGQSVLPYTKWGDRCLRQRCHTGVETFLGGVDLAPGPGVLQPGRRMRLDDLLGEWKKQPADQSPIFIFDRSVCGRMVPSPDLPRNAKLRGGEVLVVDSTLDPESLSRT